MRKRNAHIFFLKSSILSLPILKKRKKTLAKNQGAHAISVSYFRRETAQNAALAR